ncbi:MAG: hypothetical protein WB217_17115 [Mesobacillus sp.]|uniref:hypothetical protein n=1 Tax=Mesobacillus sp. TaxID=2675271 RepID=UPI003C6850A8
MSLKAIEMQIALPRTQDAGKIQEQLQQRGQHLQEHAAQSVKKEDELKRKTVIKNNQKQETRLNKDDRSSNHNQEQSNPDKKKNSENHNKQQNHPYKGKVIDYSG